MSVATISEVLFETLCEQRTVSCYRLPAGASRTADYRVDLRSISVITEVKQLEENDEDRRLALVWGTQQSPGAVAPSNRVQGMLEDAYPQIKCSSEGRLPTMIVVYNNSGPWNSIDAFTVSIAMFGSFGFVLGLTAENTVTLQGHGYLGERKVTKDTFRSLSVIGVMERSSNDAPYLRCYHNPFAIIPIQPTVLSTLADAQYIHANPHDRGFVPWAPDAIET